MECPVCLELYDLQQRRPKVLVPCGHSVCLDCLTDPNFGMQCPMDRQPLQGNLAELPDCLAVINFITQDRRKPRLALWCRDCDKDLTEECFEAGHNSCTLRQFHTERLSSHLVTLETGVEAASALKQHFEAVGKDVQRQMQASSASQHQLQEALGQLRVADGAQAGLQQRAMQVAEQLGERVEQLELDASLVGLRGECSVVAQSEDGAEWRASVALQDGQRRALRHALLELHADGDLRKVVGKAASTVDQWSLDLNDAALRTEKTLDEAAHNILKGGSLKGVRALKGVRCFEGPKFCELLLQALSPQLEELEMQDPRKEHMQTLNAMPFLRELSIAWFIDDDGCTPESVSTLATTLKELSIWGADLEHLKMIKKLVALRKLEVHCRDYYPSAPELPLLLEELTLGWCSGQHILSIQKMPRLTRLFLDGIEPKATAVPATPASHLGLSWLRMASMNKTIQQSLIEAHARTLREIQILCSPVAGNLYSFEGFAEWLRGCSLPRLERLVLLRCLPDRRPRVHTAKACQLQVTQLRDALLRKDATGAEELVEVVCNLCDEGVEL